MLSHPQCICGCNGKYGDQVETFLAVRRAVKHLEAIVETSTPANASLQHTINGTNPQQIRSILRFLKREFNLNHHSAAHIPLQNVYAVPSDILASNSALRCEERVSTPSDKKVVDLPRQETSSRLTGTSSNNDTSPQSASSANSAGAETPGAASGCRKEWSPPTWHLRTSVTHRRISGDAIELESQFEQRTRRLRRLFRRRKSFGTEAIELAAYQSHQLTYLRETALRRSAPISSTIASYRRSRSAVTLSVERTLSGCERRSSRLISTLRQASVLGGNCEVWPESVTGLLTGTQLLVDRSILLGQLSELDFSPAPPSATPASLSLKSAGVTIPRYDKKSGEDSYFITERFIGVADGVGEWGELGCSPRNFADELMEGARRRAIILEHQHQQYKLQRKELGDQNAARLNQGPYGRFPISSANDLMSLYDAPKGQSYSNSPASPGGTIMSGSTVTSDGANGEDDDTKYDPQHSCFGYSSVFPDFNAPNPPTNNVQPPSAVSGSSDALGCLMAGFESAVSFGSSTALIAGLRENGELGVANLGDSACLILRRETRGWRYFVPLRRTREQQHFFNCPYQLSHIPKRADLPALLREGMHGLARVLADLGSSAHLEGDTPDMADLYDVKVQSGDLILLGSDGVFDNLFDQEIAALVSFAISPREAAALVPHLESKGGLLPHPNSVVPPIADPVYGLATPPKYVAQAVAEAAFLRSQDPRARTPFARQSRKAGGYFHGGKLDDITVVAAWVIGKGELEAQRNVLLTVIGDLSPGF